jgi:hypothetical protein
MQAVLMPWQPVAAATMLEERVPAHPTPPLRIAAAAADMQAAAHRAVAAAVVVDMPAVVAADDGNL